jgi:hypothetical protein
MGSVRILKLQYNDFPPKVEQRKIKANKPYILIILKGNKK